MVDLLAARARSVADFAPEPIDGGRVVITAAESVRRWLAQGAVEGMPMRPMSSATVGDFTALWLGPQEWLLLGPETAALPWLGDAPHALVDVSHRTEALLLFGPGAALALAGAVPLDLSLAAFPVGMCTRTIFEKTGIMLWRREAGLWHVEAGRSFLPYVWRLLAGIAASDAG
jgi:sarcosine oxidase subunit gamma